MELALYFSPIQSGIEEPLTGTIGQLVSAHSEEAGFPYLDGIDIAIIGVPDERGAVGNQGCSEGPNAIRKELYKLFPGAFALRMVDLGNIEPGQSMEDTHFAIGQSVAELLERKITPVILGASQDLTYGNYLGYELQEKVVNIVTLDGKLDIGQPKQPLNAETYLSKIVLKQPNFLFNYINIGYQTYFVSQERIDIMDKLFFECTRLGEARGNLQETEPLLRDADMVSVDISCVKRADAPGNKNAGPNGFYGEELCQMARYAGMSEKLSSFGIYELNPTIDQENQTSGLVAQVLWCFIDGFYARKGDFPIATKKEYIKYRVAIENHQHEIIFYKSLKSDRWWMDVPYPPAKRVRFQRHHFVPCTYADYQTACEDEVPDKWWKTYRKLS